jgi:hypothetical protein
MGHEPRATDGYNVERRAFQTGFRNMAQKPPPRRNVFITAHAVWQIIGEARERTKTRVPPKSYNKSPSLSLSYVNLQSVGVSGNPEWTISGHQSLADTHRQMVKMTRRFKNRQGRTSTSKAPISRFSIEQGRQIDFRSSHRSKASPCRLVDMTKCRLQLKCDI